MRDHANRMNYRGFQREGERNGQDEGRGNEERQGYGGTEIILHLPQDNI